MNSSRHIYVNIVKLTPPIQDIVKRDISVLNVLRRDRRQINPRRRNLTTALNLIDKYIIGFLTPPDTTTNIIIKEKRITQGQERLVIKVNGDDMIIRNTFFPQPLAKKRVE